MIDGLPSDASERLDAYLGATVTDRAESDH